MSSGDPRLQREIVHHRRLAVGRPECVWGWGSPAGRIRADRRAQLFQQIGHIASGMRVLELGCGTGEFTVRVAASRARIVALDLVAELLVNARRKIEAGHSVDFIRGDAQVLPFSSSTFDAVFGCSVLHHIDQELALREVRRVLRPGGRLVFSEPNLLNPIVFLMFQCRPLRRRFNVSADESAFTRWKAIKLLQQAGFERIMVRYFDFLHPAVPRRFIRPVAAVGACMEQLPLLSALAGSLLISAARPHGNLG